MEPRISFVTLGVEDLERSSLSWAGPGLPSIPGTCSPLMPGCPTRDQGSRFPGAQRPLDGGGGPGRGLPLSVRGVKV
jgi:hypothetical protein